MKRNALADVFMALVEVSINIMFKIDWPNRRFYGVMAITLDFESNNPSSNLGRTSSFFQLRFSISFFFRFTLKSSSGTFSLRLRRHQCQAKHSKPNRTGTIKLSRRVEHASNGVQSKSKVKRVSIRLWTLLSLV